MPAIVSGFALDSNSLSSLFSISEGFSAGCTGSSDWAAEDFSVEFSDPPVVVELSETSSALVNDVESSSISVAGVVTFFVGVSSISFGPGFDTAGLVFSELPLNLWIRILAPHPTPAINIIARTEPMSDFLSVEGLPADGKFLFSPLVDDSFSIVSS